MHEQSPEEQQDWSSIVAWDEAERLAESGTSATQSLEEAVAELNEAAAGMWQPVMDALRRMAEWVEKKAGGSWKA